MNYRHAYHAGNFADVLKHVVLARVIEYLKRKETALRVIDTHAGAGRYDLTAREAAKTGEWRNGIGRLLGPNADPLPPAVAALLAPYLDAVRAVNDGAQLRTYPGSPALALHMLRAQDRLIANELHPDAQAQLKAAFGRDARAKVMQLDGWTALRALLPPKERRGLVLIDPAFEEQGEFDRCITGLTEGLQRFATGVFVIWFPVKDRHAVSRFYRLLPQAVSAPLLAVELATGHPTRSERESLDACGLIVANPPYALRAELAAILPILTQRLATRAGARYRLELLMLQKPRREAT